MYNDTDLVKFWGLVISYDMPKSSENELNCEDCEVYYGPLVRLLLLKIYAKL